MKSRHFWLSRDKSGSGQMNIDCYKMKLGRDGYYRTRAERNCEGFSLMDNEAYNRFLQVIGVKLKRGQQVKAKVVGDKR